MKSMMRMISAVLGIGGLWLGLIAPAAATGGGDRCPKDSVLSGTLCIDKYEASVWRVPDPTGANKRLVNKIRRGTVTLTDLTAAGAVQPGGQGGSGCRWLPGDRQRLRGLLRCVDPRGDALGLPHLVPGGGRGPEFGQAPAEQRRVAGRGARDAGPGDRQSDDRL